MLKCFLDMHPDAFSKLSSTVTIAVVCKFSGKSVDTNFSQVTKSVLHD